MQSERMYQAVSLETAEQTRLVTLPLEAHGYADAKRLSMSFTK